MEKYVPVVVIKELSETDKILKALKNIGDWVENGEYPEDYETLENIVKDISYNNAYKYFNI